MKSAVSTPQEQRPYCSPFNALGVLSARALDQPPYSNHPSTQVAVKLWNHFKECVDTACNACLLHIPTDEVKVYSVIQDPAKASYENLALCFAIYFTTVASLTEEDAKILLGHDRTAALFLFKDGLEQSFAYADFLDCPTVTLLNALSTYIVRPSCSRPAPSSLLLTRALERLAHPQLGQRHMDPQWTRIAHRTVHRLTPRRRAAGTPPFRSRTQSPHVVAINMP